LLKREAEPPSTKFDSAATAAGLEDASTTLPDSYLTGAKKR
jgi:hypothetical protein